LDRPVNGSKGWIPDLRRGPLDLGHRVVVSIIIGHPRLVDDDDAVPDRRCTSVG